MSLYAVIKGNIVDGIAVADDPLETQNIWVCIDNVEPKPGPHWTYEDGVFSPPTPPAQPVLPNIITKIAFRFRLTDAEYVGILAAAKKDVEVAAWVETFNMVSQIKLDDPRTVSGVETLVVKDLLTEERAEEILTAPVQPDERP
jgi:hypothetical protein